MQVLRSYDSRFRPTARRSDLYFVDDLVPQSKRICILQDDPNQSQSEALPPDESDKHATNKVVVKLRMREHLFSFTGKLEIIATPFHEGRHYARRPEDFIPVVKHLREIHQKGCVHGDIRCFNIIFGSCLIDFDFGGQVDSTNFPTYPEGYSFTLPSGDGYRVGEEGDRITPEGDTYAMTMVVFVCHEFVPPVIAPIRAASAGEAQLEPSDNEANPPIGVGASNELDYLRALLKQRDEKDELVEDLKAYPHGRDGADPEKQLAKLTDFLERAASEGWKVTVSKPFLEGLDKCGISVSQEVRGRHVPRQGAQPAGSGLVGKGSPNQPPSNAGKGR